MRHTNGDRTGDRMERFPVTEAANILGISTEATRQRIKRGTLPTERDEEGNVFVLLKRTNADGTRTDSNDTEDGTSGGTHTNANRTDNGTDDKERLIEVLRDQLQEEREANRENRRIIAGLVQRVPELEAAPEPRDIPDTASKSEGRGDDVLQEQQEPTERRSWLYRFFFGP